MQPIVVDPTLGIIIAGIITLATAALTAILTQWAKSSDREQDRKDRADAREEDRKDRDAVAAQAAQAAALLVESNDRVAREVAKATALTNGKLDEVKAVADTVHTLVNSNMTKEMRARLSATTRDLRSLTEIIRLNRKQGLEPSPEAVAELEATKLDIAAQTLALEDREKQVAAQATPV